MPSVLILGGVGFIGRHFVNHLVENNLASPIRVVDKVLPETAYLSDRHKKSFASVEFLQGNLCSQQSIQKCFDGQWDLIVNFAAETKYGKPEEVYDEKVFLVTEQCAKEAAKKNSIFLEFSTAQVYDAHHEPNHEGSKIKPWTLIAKAKAKGEEALKNISGLKYVVVRPALVYGPDDVNGLTPRLIVGHVYKHLGEEMKLLWSKDLQLETVHVDDAVRATWHLMQWYQKDPSKANGQCFNLADKNKTDQESVNVHLRDIFGIKTGFQGAIISNFAKLNLSSVTEDINEKHLTPWSDMCKKSGISNSPLTPYLDQELLYNNSLSVDGTKIEKDTGFVYNVPKMTTQHLREVIERFQEMRLWPKE